MQNVAIPALSLLCRGINIYLVGDLGKEKQLAFAFAEQLALYGVKELLEGSKSPELKLADLLDKFGGIQLKTASDFLRLTDIETTHEGKQVHRTAAATSAVSAYNVYMEECNYYGAVKAAIVAATIFWDLTVTLVASREYAELARKNEELHYLQAKSAAYAQLPTYDYPWHLAGDWMMGGARAGFMAGMQEGGVAGRFAGGALGGATGAAAGTLFAGCKGGFQHIRYAVTIKKARAEYNTRIAELEQEKEDVFKTCDRFLKV